MGKSVAQTFDDLLNTCNLQIDRFIDQEPGIVVQTINDPLASPTLEPVDGCSEAELHWVKAKHRQLFEAQKQYEAMKQKSVDLIHKNSLSDFLTLDWHRQEEIIQQLHERLDRAEADAQHWAEMAQQCGLQVIQEDLLAESERAVRHWQSSANALKEQLNAAEKKYLDAHQEMALMRERLEDDRLFCLEQIETLKDECDRLMKLKNDEFLKRHQLENEFKQQPNWKKAWQHLTEDYGQLERLNRQLFISCIVAVTFSLTLIGVLVFK